MMTPEEINEALRQKGVTKKAIAQECNRSETLVYAVVKKEASNRNIQTSIAEKLGEPVEAIFGPNTYDPSKSRGKTRRPSYPRLKVQWHEFS